MRSSRHRYLGRSAKISERLKVEKAPSENGNGYGTVTPPPPVAAPEEPKKKRSRKKQSYSPDELAETNNILAEWFNIVYGRLQVGEVLEWLRELGDVAVDIETYSEFPHAADRKKQPCWKSSSEAHYGDG